MHPIHAHATCFQRALHQDTHEQQMRSPAWRSIRLSAPTRLRLAWGLISMINLITPRALVAFAFAAAPGRWEKKLERLSVPFGFAGRKIAIESWRSEWRKEKNRSTLKPSSSAAAATTAPLTAFVLMEFPFLVLFVLRRQVVISTGGAARNLCTLQRSPRERHCNFTSLRLIRSSA